MVDQVSGRAVTGTGSAGHGAAVQTRSNPAVRTGTQAANGPYVLKPTSRGSTGLHALVWGNASTPLILIGERRPCLRNRAGNRIGAAICDER